MKSIKDFMDIEVGDAVSMSFDVDDPYLFGSVGKEVSEELYVDGKKEMHVDMLTNYSHIYTEYDSADEYIKFVEYVVDYLYEDESKQTMYTLKNMFYPFIEDISTNTNKYSFELEKFDLEENNIYDIIDSYEEQTDLSNNTDEFASGDLFGDVTNDDDDNDIDIKIDMLYPSLLYNSVKRIIGLLELQEYNQVKKSESIEQYPSDTEERLGTEEFRYNPNEPIDTDDSDGSDESNDEKNIINFPTVDLLIGDKSYDCFEDLTDIEYSPADDIRTKKRHITTIYKYINKPLVDDGEFEEFCYELSKAISMPDTGTYTPQDIKENLEEYLESGTHNIHYLKDYLEEHPDVYTNVYLYHYNRMIEDLT